jgi:peptidoglycan/LPS O-acetylase OafA/YrhL
LNSSTTGYGQVHQPSGGRANGLDTLRAAAITLVFMYHYRAFVSHEPTFGPGSIVGWVGVDLFFVLSGYLIANQIFSGIAQHQKLSLKFFYARRALRTLPAFWFVLALYFIFPAVMGGRTPPPVWRFLTFTQNFDLHTGTAFSHAWSLCIEEQFYFVLPLAVLMGFWDARAQARGWALLLALLLVGMTARTVLWFTYGRESGGYFPNIYYATLCRFDEFLPGVAVAMLKNFHRPVWDRITQHGQRVLAIGSVAAAAMLYGAYRFYDIDGYGYGFFMTAAGYSLVAMAFAVLVMAALSPGSWLHRIRIPGLFAPGDSRQALRAQSGSKETQRLRRRCNRIAGRNARAQNWPPLTLGSKGERGGIRATCRCRSRTMHAASAVVLRHSQRQPFDPVGRFVQHPLRYSGFHTDGVSSYGRRHSKRYIDRRLCRGGDGAAADSGSGGSLHRLAQC